MFNNGSLDLPERPELPERPPERPKDNRGLFPVLILLALFV